MSLISLAPIRSIASLNCSKPTGYIYVHITGSNPNGYAEEAPRLFARESSSCGDTVTPGSGQYEAAQRVNRKLVLIIPLTLLLVPCFSMRVRNRFQNHDQWGGRAIFGDRRDLAGIPARL